MMSTSEKPEDNLSEYEVELSDARLSSSPNRVELYVSGLGDNFEYRIAVASGDGCPALQDFSGTQKSDGVIAVNLSALPWTICSPSTITARVGAARKKLLIQPSRTADSAMTTTPKIIPKRQAVSLVVSGVRNSVA